MLRRSTIQAVGVSAMAVFAPPARVELKEWCDWTGNSWDKVSSVVGSSFRIPCANENAYTMAAGAVLRLILNNDVDPQRVGFLGFGTESSTDNSAGAVIIRGMVDSALSTLGKPRLSRQCEVPEFKHACLGGIYALKSGARYASTDGSDRLAIVVASDIAEYARGSTGEQTQGAGAVAMLVENTPQLFELDLAHAGSGSAYRGPDFRKPVKRHFIPGYHASPVGDKIPDFPVFSGPYSTVAYLEEVAQAVEAMLSKMSQRPSDYYNEVTGLFFHRPYNMMPIQAMSFLYARALARSTSADHVARFESLCKKAKVTPDAVRADLDGNAETDLFSFIEQGKEAPTSLFGPTNAIAKALRAEKEFTDLLDKKMSLGSKTMAEFGNLYTAALPCWLAAGFEEAVETKKDLTGKPMVIVGYGSGDAAEAIPIKPVVGWEKAASRIGVRQALEDGVTLSREQYQDLHSGKLKDDLAISRKNQFVIGRLGHRNEVAFQDIGIEYYSFAK
jgi:hydroxymethylglutaryl-CoA synthase